MSALLWDSCGAVIASANKIWCHELTSVSYDSHHALQGDNPQSNECCMSLMLYSEWGKDAWMAGGVGSHAEIHSHLPLLTLAVSTCGYPAVHSVNLLFHIWMSQGDLMPLFLCHSFSLQKHQWHRYVVATVGGCLFCIGPLSIWVPCFLYNSASYVLLSGNSRHCTMKI